MICGLDLIIFSLMLKYNIYFLYDIVEQSKYIYMQTWYTYIDKKENIVNGS